MIRLPTRSTRTDKPMPNTTLFRSQAPAPRLGGKTTTLVTFASILLLHLMGAISPGPAFVMVVRTAAVEGFRPAVFAALGLAAGAVIWALAALLGLTFL